MAKWIIFFQERFPFHNYFILSLGFAFSGAAIHSDSLKWIPIFFVTLGLMLFFFELRLMDEFKDYSKDVIAHPHRPLPRKLLGLDQIHHLILISFVLMIAFSVGVSFLSNPLAGGLYLSMTLYLGLMFKEFFIGQRLSQYPLTYGITHQLILIPVCLFSGTFQNARNIYDSQFFSYSISVLGAFFSYEICRKLNPNAHPILKTYLSVYGPIKTTFFVWTLLTIAGTGALFFDAAYFLWPIEWSVLLSMLLFLFQPARYKWVEKMAILSLCCHIWAGLILSLFRRIL